jgi:hypothetical protein
MRRQPREAGSLRERLESIALKGPYRSLSVSNGPFRAWLAPAPIRFINSSDVPGNAGCVNRIDPTVAEWPVVYCGDNLLCLRNVVEQYGPDRVFLFSREIVF